MTSISGAGTSLQPGQIPSCIAERKPVDLLDPDRIARGKRRAWGLLRNYWYHEKKEGNQIPHESLDDKSVLW